jgi:hypothetical protein
MFNQTGEKNLASPKQDHVICPLEDPAYKFHLQCYMFMLIYEGIFCWL